MAFLDNIHLPEDLRRLNRESLEEVTDELRHFLLEKISQSGGHLASNLGSVELTVGLHYVFDTPRDKIVWDVGHQAYGHKVLTGRKEQFHTIRQNEGLSGFTVRNESEFDHFGAGHASTSISAALGIAEGIRLQGLKNFGIAVIGDGSLTGGLVYEAMNNAGHIPAKNLLVVFNDNNMSIDPNVGALREFVNKAVTHPSYNRLRKDLKLTLEALSESGIPIADLAGKVRKSLKHIFTPGMLFECFGFRYFGPINGHDIEAVVDAFLSIREMGPDGGPYLVHALTTKGRGYKLAEQMPIKYHGVNPFNISDGIKSSGKSVPKYQDVFAETLIKLAKKDPRILAITAAMPSGTGLNLFQKEFPSRCYDVGIAEAHAVLFAAGLASEGFKPVVAIYSTFLQRAFDQLIHDVALQNLNVIFALDRAGLVGADGATHQGAFDLSYLRCLPNFVVMAPKDEVELQNMILTAIEYDKGPIAFRYPRGEVVGVAPPQEPRILPIGLGELIETDSQERVDILFIAVGFAVQSVLGAQGFIREKGIRTAVVNARFIKPLDESLITHWAQKARLVVTVEENSALGGFGSAVLELLSREKILVPSLILGMPDVFIEHASPREQREETGLDAQSIANKASERFFEMEADLELPNRKKPLLFPKIKTEPTYPQ